MESISRNLSTPFLTIVFNRIFCGGLFFYGFDKKFLGELRKTLPIAMRKFSRNFSVLWLKRFCRCQGIRALYGSKMIAKVFFLQYIISRRIAD